MSSPSGRLLLTTQVASAILALILGVLVVTGLVQVWHVFVLALLLGVVNSFDMPVRQSFVVEMVGRDDVANAVALNSAVFNLTRIIGPAIAGLTIAAIGLEPLFFVNCVELPRDDRRHLPDAAARAASADGTGRDRAQLCAR